jgi:hypothetical protein
MDEGAFGAVAGDDIDAVIAAFEGCGGVIEAKIAFGFYRAVAANARGFEDWFYVASEIDLIGGRGRELGFIDWRRAEKGGG